jgi:hypothetical protein
MDRTADARTLLVDVAAHWRRQRLSAWGSAVAACALLGAALGTRVGMHPAIAAGAGGVVMAIWAFNQIRARPITARTVAEHADRTVPAVEESATLLLTDDDTLPFIAKVQRGRVADALLAAESIPRLPHASARLAAQAAAIALVSTVALMLLPTLSTARSARIVSESAEPAVLPQVTLGAVALSWTPPAYLGRAPQSRPAGEVTVEEGSIVRWQIAATNATDVRLVDARGDTLPAIATPDGWEVSRQLDAPMLWRAEAVGHDGTVVRGADLRLGVRLDKAPVIAILAPLGRVTLDWSEPHVVVVRALVSDDHALGSVGLLATHARGRGEGVRFRETSLGVEVESTNGPAGRVVSRRVDLDSLGIEPGDEVYLAFTATDRKAPVPQLTRAETIFLAVRDTFDLGTGALAGVAITVEPAFFRSQRQIVLDTEALLRDARLGTMRNTMPRSLEIGLDQEALRLRYGALVGQEAEGIGEDDHDHEEAVDEDGRPVEVTMEDFVHRHDMEENATLLAASVKSTLKRALAAMWDAEKALRTGRPKDALPHEYAALAALEEIRLTERAYVKRIGFEPPAVDIEKARLSRTAKGLGPATRTTTLEDHRTEPLLRDALAVLEAPSSAGRTAVLEEAGRRLATIILEGDAPGTHLESLGALRSLLDGSCDDCVTRVRQGLLAALPVPPPPIVPRTP